MPSSRGRLGTLGERAAEAYLASLGYTILARNYRCLWGEIDLVARDGDTLVFVEVRARRSRSYGIPEESVTVAKVRRLIATAETYLQEHDLEISQWRIDLVAVEHAGGQRHVRHIPNAIDRA